MAERLFCIHCLRSSEVVKTWFDTVPELMDHIGREHHRQQPLHGRDWLFGDSEVDAFREQESRSGIEVADTFRRLALVETVEDFLKLL